MNRLPSEILLLIFRSIDDFRVLIKLGQVCRRWHKIIRDHGWKHIQRIARLSDAHWIEPIGEHCGKHLVECCFHSVDIDSNLIRLIAENFPAIRHLEFRFCEVNNLDSNTMQTYREFGARLRSLTFFETNYQNQLGQHLLPHMPHLQHLGLHLSCQHNTGSLPSRFSADLRSLYLSCFTEFNSDLEQMLIRVQRDSPRLAALNLDTIMSAKSARSEHLLGRISVLKNLRFLRISFHYDFFSLPFQFLCSFLNNLPQLRALQINLPFERLSADGFGLPPFRGLIHLSLSLFAGENDSFEHIRFLSMIPQLRSLDLDVPAYLLDRAHGIESEVLNIAQNGLLEYLNVKCASFPIRMLGPLIRHCPNLQSLGVRPFQIEQFSRVSQLRHIVADQWRAGTRKHLPLRIWIYGHPIPWRWQDPFLTIHTVHPGFTPPNPVLDELFREEVFNDNESGGIPSFVTEHYSSRA